MRPTPASWTQEAEGALARAPWTWEGSDDGRQVRAAGRGRGLSRRRPGRGRRHRGRRRRGGEAHEGALRRVGRADGGRGRGRTVPAAGRRRRAGRDGRPRNALLSQALEDIEVRTALVVLLRCHGTHLPHLPGVHITISAGRRRRGPGSGERPLHVLRNLVASGEAKACCDVIEISINVLPCTVALVGGLCERLEDDPVELPAGSGRPPRWGPGPRDYGPFR